MLAGYFFADLLHEFGRNLQHIHDLLDGKSFEQHFTDMVFSGFFAAFFAAFRKTDCTAFRTACFPCQPFVMLRDDCSIVMVGAVLKCLSISPAN